MNCEQTNAEEHIFVTLLVTKFGLTQEIFGPPDPQLNKMIKIFVFIGLLEYFQKTLL